MDEYDKMHALHMEAYERKLRKAYNNALQEIATIGTSLRLNTENALYFAENAAVNKKVNEVMKTLFLDVYGTTVMGINEQWDLGNEKNNALAEKVFGKSLADLPDDYRAKYFSNNDMAKRNFINRRNNGLGLSDKVWGNTKQVKQEMELALEQAIGKGRSAASIAVDLKKYLNDPDKLFRRVRDSETGVLRLSKAGAAYHPGAGKYRSSYKNAVRLTRNEINFSYEGAQFERRKQQDFIVGIEIKVSPAHQEKDDAGGISCTNLQGRYPKTFDFSSKWHVNCKCMTLHILKTPEELAADTKRILEGKDPYKQSINSVNEVPPQFTKEINANKDKWANWKNQPRFMTANEAMLNGQPLAAVTAPTTVEPPNKSTFVLDDAAQARIKAAHPDIEIVFQGRDSGSPLTAYQYGQKFGTFDVETLITNIKADVASMEGEFIKNIKIGIDFKNDGYIDVFGNSYYIKENSARGLRVTRSFITDKEQFAVNHDYFTVPEHFQGGGFSKKLMATFYQEYQRAGVTRVNVHANIDVGGYSWAKYGFQHEMDQQGIKILKELLEDRFAWNNNLLEEAEEVVNHWVSTHPEGTSFPMNLLSTPKFKESMLNSDWSGFIDFNNVQQRVYFENYIKGL